MKALKRVEAVLAGALDAQGPPPGAIHLRIRCDGEIVYFKVGLQVSIGAVFEAFAERKRLVFIVAVPRRRC